MAKVILYKSKKLKDETHPIVIRWYEQGRQKVFTVGSCTKKQWDDVKGRVKKSHPFADQINEKIKEHLGQAILHGGIKKETQSTLLLDFIEARRQRAELNGSLGQFDKLNHIATNIKDWNKNAHRITLDSFTASDAESFYEHLILVVKNNKNTSAKKMQDLKAIFNSARKSRLTVNDPFLNLSYPTVRTIKSKLSRVELSIIEELDLSNHSRVFHITRDSFVFQFYMRGIRIGDALSLTQQHIIGDRIVFTESKTRKHRSIQIHPKVLDIINRYNGESPYLIPAISYRHNNKLSDAQNEIKFHKSIRSATSVINRYLKKIGSMAEIDTNISTHIARHSFAKIAIDTVKNIRVSQELLGHSSLRVHQDYIRDLEDNDELDLAANDIYG